MPPNRPATASVSGAGVTLDEAVHGEQVRVFIEDHADRYLTLLIAAIVVGVVRHLYPAWVLITWFSLSAATVFGRTLLARRYRAAQRSPQEVRRWAAVFAAGAGVTGILWGCVGSIPLVTTSPAMQFFSVMIAGGITAGGLMLDAAYSPAMAAFAGPAIMPGIIILLSRGDVRHTGMAILLALFGAIVLTAALKLNRVLKQNIRFRFEHNAMLEKLQSSESAMAEAQELANVGSWVLDVKTRTMAMSPEAYRIFGIDPADPAPDFSLVAARIHPDERPMIAAMAAAPLTGQNTAGIELRLVMDDGTVKYVLINPRPILDAAGQTVRVAGSVQDVTSRQAAEDRLQFANILLSTQMEASRDGILVVDEAGKIVVINQRYGEISQTRSDDLLGQHYSVAVDRFSALMKDRPALSRRMASVAANPLETSEAEFETVDGRFISRYVAPLRAANGAFQGQAVFFTDVTDRKLADETLAYRDRLLRAVTTATTLAVAALTTGEDVKIALAKIGEAMRVDRIILFRKPRDAVFPALPMFVWQSAAVHRPYAVAQIARQDLDRAELAAWRAPLAEGKPVITQLATAEGSARRVLEHHGAESSLFMPVFVAGSYWGYLCIDTCTAARDWSPSEIETTGILAEISGSMIARERARTALATSERRFRLLTTAAQDAVIMTDEASIILQWNQAAERITGHTQAEALGRNVIDLLGLRNLWTEIESQLKTINRNTGATLELLIRPKAGGELWVDVSISAARIGERVEYITIMRDISARKKAEQELQFANVLLKKQMEASRDGIIVTDASARIIAVSQRYGEVAGAKVDDLLGQNVFVALERVSKGFKDPAAFMRSMASHSSSLPSGDEETYEFADGRVVTGYRTSLHGPNGDYLGRAAFYTDVTESKQAAATLAYRDRLLSIVATAAATAIGRLTTREEVTAALGKIGEGMGVDRILLFRKERDPALPVSVRFSWASAPIYRSYIIAEAAIPDLDHAALAAWQQPLEEGKPVTAQRATAQGAVLRLLEHHRTESVLRIPVFVDEKLWGFLGIDSCTAAREWAASEIETATILADIAGSLIVRERARIAIETSERRFRQLTNTARDAVMLTNEAAIIGQWNRAAEAMFGYTAAEAVGQDLVVLLGQRGKRAEIGQALRDFVASGDLLLELPFRRKDGSNILVEISTSATRIDGAVEYISIMRDVSERKIAEQKLTLSNALLKTQLEASPDGVFVVNENKILSYNQRFLDMWSVSEAEVLLAGPGWFRERAKEFLKDGDAYNATIDYLISHPEETTDDVLETIDGRIIERHGVSLLAPGQNLGRAWFYRDVTARRAADAAALRLARYDALTGLANRALFVEAMDQAIAHARRENTRFAVLFLDLDHFKDVNDTLGHPAGDALLKCVTARLLTATRETDTVGRFGGDEFAVILAGVQDAAVAGVMAERLIAAINKPLDIGSNTIQVRASIGIELFSPNAEDSETLLAHADVALYRAKAEGRGTYRFFTDDMDKEVRNRVTLGTELREAINSGALVVLYQPQVDVTTGTITGVEALIRWPHPTRGLISAKTFMEAAETTGAVNDLGRFALWTACRQAAAWRQAGYFLPRISMNVSSMQLKTATTLEADILAILAETGLPPHLLELELTESALIGAANETDHILHRLKESGVKFAIDHFGTGYSSLDYLRRFPTDHIKIPRTFTKNIEIEAGDASIVRAIIGLATELGVETIAEGVETRSQLNLIARWGCTQMQGYYFSRPVPAEDITAMLKSGGVLGARPDSPKGLWSDLVRPPTPSVPH